MYVLSRSTESVAAYPVQLPMFSNTRGVRYNYRSLNRCDGRFEPNQVAAVIAVHGRHTCYSCFAQSCCFARRISLACSAGFCSLLTMLTITLTYRLGRPVTLSQCLVLASWVRSVAVLSVQKPPTNSCRVLQIPFGRLLGLMFAVATELVGAS